MITEIQNFENAARIATADALLSDGETLPRTSAFFRWFDSAFATFFSGLRGFAGRLS